MRTLELRPRLRAVAELVPLGARLADVGTDHGYLPVWLLQHDRIKCAVAADLRPGPLNRARGTAEEFSCSDRMDFRLCDGLSDLRPGEVDAVAIAGMGGDTIAEILSAATWVKEYRLPLILQPMSSHPELRGWLWRNGYDIRREELLREGNTLYTVILAQGGSGTPMTPAEEWAGRQVLGMEAPLRGLLLERLLKRTARALSEMGQARSDRAEDHRRELETVRMGLLALKEEWSQWQQ